MINPATDERAIAEMHAWVERRLCLGRNACGGLVVNARRHYLAGYGVAWHLRDEISLDLVADKYKARDDGRGSKALYAIAWLAGFSSARAEKQGWRARATLAQDARGFLPSDSAERPRGDRC